MNNEAKLKNKTNSLKPKPLIKNSWQAVKTKEILWKRFAEQRFYN